VQALAVYQDRNADSLQTALGHLALDEAVLLPNATEANGSVRHLQLLPRLTLHVRHRQKYLDVPVLGRHAFVFTRGGVATGQRAATLADFVRVIRADPPDVLSDHLRRGDLSRWIGHVFGDTLLASQLAVLEHEYTAGDAADWREAIAGCIEERYAADSV
jgi:hypothetical protein